MNVCACVMVTSRLLSGNPSPPNGRSTLTSRVSSAYENVPNSWSRGPTLMIEAHVVLVEIVDRERRADGVEARERAGADRHRRRSAARCTAWRAAWSGRAAPPG